MFSLSMDTLTGVQSGNQGDSNLLDVFAATVSLVNDHGSYYLGRIYLALLTIPIPRPLWPDKPGLADWLNDISTIARPLSTCGMVTSFLGESYANFGYLGALQIS